MVADGYKKTDIGVIPVEWEVVKLGDIGKVSMCKRIMKNETTPEGVIPFYKIGTFGKKADAFITEELYEEYKSKYSFPKQGDILISASGTIGRLVVYDGIPAYFQDSNIVWIDNQEGKVLNNFLFYVYKTVKWHTDGNTIARLYNDNLRRIIIPLPPLKEQEKIADILSTADEKIDAIEGQIQKAETLKKGLLQKLLSEGIGHSEFKDSELGKIPESWEIVKLDNMSSVITKGTTPTTLGFNYEDSGINFIKVESIGKNGNFIIDKFAYISEEANNSLQRSIIKENDLLLSIAGALGRVAIVNKDIVPANTNQALSIIRLKDEYIKEYVYFYLNSSQIQNHIDKINVQNAQANLSLQNIKNFKIALPALKEQKQIADILSTADEKLEALRAKKEKYETLKKGLLQKLLSGEVRV